MSKFVDSVTGYWSQLYEQLNTNQAFNIKFKIYEIKTKKFKTSYETIIIYINFLSLNNA